MKGIILAGGSGTRLYPMTLAVSKQLLPVYDKPMVYYPLSVLMLAGIRDILLISTPHDLPVPAASARRRLAMGHEARLRRPAEAGRPRPGLHHRPRLRRRRPRRASILGDNIFYGHGLADELCERGGATQGATIFAYHVERSGAIWRGRVRWPGKRLSTSRRSRHQSEVQLGRHRALFLRQEVLDIAAELRPSARGELEITDVNRPLSRARQAACRQARPRLSPGSTPARTIP